MLNGPARVGRRADLELIATGEWARVGSKQYRHVSGVVVRYRHDQYLWEIVGGAADGLRYSTLTVAAYYGTR